MLGSRPRVTPLLLYFTALLLYCFTLLYFTLLRYCFIASLYSALPLQSCTPRPLATSAADTGLCFTYLLYSALLLHSCTPPPATAEDTGRKTNKGFGSTLLYSSLLCFTLIYSASLLRIQVARQRLPSCWRSAARLRSAGLRPYATSV